MEDDDSDAEMADCGTDFSDDVDPNFDAKDVHNKDPLSDSGIGNRIPRFGIGVRGRRAGDFLVC
jgi:hypothetical protein